MKRSLISIITLALLAVNLILTTIMMFSVIGTNKKTADLVTDIASAINLDINGVSNGGGAVGTGENIVPLENTATYTISDMQIPLKRDEAAPEGEKDHFAMLTITLSMDNKHKDFKTYGSGDLSEREDLIRGQINELVGGYTLEQAQGNPQQLKQDILSCVQRLFESDFIFDVTLVSTLYQ